MLQDDVTIFLGIYFSSVSICATGPQHFIIGRNFAEKVCK
jgi:hypothetical protein